MTKCNKDYSLKKIENILEIKAIRNTKKINVIVISIIKNNRRITQKKRTKVLIFSGK